jgi:DNA topoisomerase-1
LVHRHKKGKSGYDFWGCSGFKDGCRQSFPNKGGKPQLNEPKESV